MLLRRHHITILLQAVLLLFALTSCVRDDFSSDTAGTDGTDTTPYYLNVHLEFNDNSSNGNRAAGTNGDNLEYGDHSEHMIGEDGNLIILFRKDNAGNNKLFGVFALTSLSKHEHNTEKGRTDGSNNDNSVNDNIEALHAYSTKFPAEEESMFPTSCLVVLNCSEKMQEKLEEFNKKKNETTVDDILKVIWEETDVNTENPRNIGYADFNHKYFTMTNSIYFDVNGNKQADITIPKGFIAKTLMAAKPVTIRVERMVAKFSFELPEDGKNIFQPSEKADMIMFDNGFNDDGSPKLKVKKWRIALTGWNMNALETKNYLFKNIEYNKNYFEGYNDQNDWNHPGNYRSHWSEDPQYDYLLNEDGEKTDEILVYPWQYRKAIDYNLGYYEDAISKDNGKNDNLLRNYSFNDLELGRLAGGMLDIEKAFKEKIIYTPENTYDAKAVAGDNGKKHDSRDELLACTHLLVGAEVQIEKTDETDENIKKYFIETPDEDNSYITPRHLFRDRNGFCYLSERECIASLVHDFNQLLKSQSSMVFTHYGFWTNANEVNTEQIAVTKGNFSLYYKKSANEPWKELEAVDILDEDKFKDEELIMAIATLRKGDGKRLPWIDKLLENGWLAIGDNETDPSLTIHNVKENDYGTKLPGDVAGNTKDNKNYIKSLLYEWLGSIDHFNQGKMYYSHGVVDNPPIVDDKPLRYGVVRNNWYQFNLTNVKNLGTPVDDLDQPIVPERNGLNDQINFTIKIIPWHYIMTTIDKL